MGQAAPTPPPVVPDPTPLVPEARPLSEQLDALARIEDAVVSGRQKLEARGFKGWSVQDRMNNERKARIFRAAAEKLRGIGS